MPRLTSYRDFWVHYLSLHTTAGCRLLHLLGTGGGLISVVLAIAARSPVVLIYGLAFGYGCAWAGHFFFEKNLPATFRHPIWSFVSDLRLFVLVMRGGLRRFWCYFNAW